MLNQEAFLPGNTCAAIIVAAGSGSRLGGHIPKQFQSLNGKPMLLWSVEPLLHCEEIASLVIVLPADAQDSVADLLPKDGRIVVTAGGTNRTDSVRNGLAVLKSRLPSKVLIHDAARPGLRPDVIRELISALDTADAAAPALPIPDAIKSVGEDGRLATVARDALVRVQTPQAFRWQTILEAYESDTGAVDDLALVEKSGARVTLTPGRTELMKVTHPEDLAIVGKLISTPALRVGTGFDVHGFEDGNGVTLCGVRIPHSRSLQGHSDADAGWHALTDAILGAAALGDIGDHFPPSDPKWKGASSDIFLRHTVKLVADKGFRIVNADITLLCEKPKIGPHREAMRAATAETLGVDIASVSVKATTTERLGFLGREEGVAAQAVVLLAG
ncbi:MAG: bifunctional 2-C-methyl-D-erythritol 4-phosphate cytidylyltransferase/2-C-methyl-D-erythritol 2,4-cyclodiphosphate synthase [Alphaproteobacteria bacterium]|nr:bifunctional 2-C-methyl-D-erythritol 4-phosphate cytidylyltransferase/2-C-methyl-D-erythritol 2,4-cyclodiphosphate synthase [Alphaproteobacteria bacterium]